MFHYAILLLSTITFLKPFCEPLWQCTSATVACAFTACYLNVSPEHKGKACCNDKLQGCHIVVSLNEVLDAHDEEEDGDDEAHEALLIFM